MNCNFGHLISLYKDYNSGGDSFSWRKGVIICLMNSIIAFEFSYFVHVDGVTKEQDEWLAVVNLRSLFRMLCVS